MPSSKVGCGGGGMLMSMLPLFFLLAIIFVIVSSAAEEAEVETETAEVNLNTPSGDIPLTKDEPKEEAAADTRSALPPGHPPVSDEQLRKAKGRCPIHAMTEPVKTAFEFFWDLPLGRALVVIGGALVLVGGLLFLLALDTRKGGKLPVRP